MVVVRTDIAEPMVTPFAVEAKHVVYIRYDTNGPW